MKEKFKKVGAFIEFIFFCYYILNPNNQSLIIKNIQEYDNNFHKLPKPVFKNPEVSQKQKGVLQLHTQQ